MTYKLFSIRCKGLQGNLKGSQTHGFAYVVARDSAQAHQMVKDSLAKKGLGTPYDREMEAVELLAEESDYPACGISLYL